MSDAVLDLPSAREEAWRWADLGGLAAAAALAPIAAPEADFLDLPGAKLLFIDGVFDEARSDLHRVTIGTLAADDHPLGRRAGGTGHDAGERHHAIVRRDGRQYAAGDGEEQQHEERRLGRRPQVQQEEPWATPGSAAPDAWSAPGSYGDDTPF